MATVRIRKTVVSGAWLTGVAAAAALAVAGPQTATAAAIEDKYEIRNETGRYLNWDCTGCGGNFTTNTKRSSGRLYDRQYRRFGPTQMQVTATYKPFNYQTATVNFTQFCGSKPCTNSTGIEAYNPRTWSVEISQAVVGAPNVTTTGRTDGPYCSSSKCIITLTPPPAGG